MSQTLKILQNIGLRSIESSHTFLVHRLTVTCIQIVDIDCVTYICFVTIKQTYNLLVWCLHFCIFRVPALRVQHILFDNPVHELEVEALTKRLDVAEMNMLQLSLGVMSMGNIAN